MMFATKRLLFWNGPSEKVIELRQAIDLSEYVIQVRVAGVLVSKDEQHTFTSEIPARDAFEEMVERSLV